MRIGLKHIALAAGLGALLCACGRSGGDRNKEETGSEVRAFPMVSIPSVVGGDPVQRAEYLAGHWWDGYFSKGGRTDSAYVLGVPKDEVEQNVANYITILHLLPVNEAQKYVAGLFSDVEAGCLRDSLHSNAAYILLTDLFTKYLYDANSPLRSEDLYAPFVKGLVSSPLTEKSKLAGYRFELEKCAMNPCGSVAADFAFLDARGRRYRLSGVEAGYTLLFFSNPGCQSCREIIDEISSRPYIDDLIEAGHLAVVNVYIDGEVDKWKEYEPNYPDNWINGYDPVGAINEGELYYVRAIPSLYLLDSQKRVMLKDAPVDRVLGFFDNMIKPTQYD